MHLNLCQEASSDEPRFSNEPDNQPLRGDEQKEAVGQESDMEFEDLPVDEQNDLEATYQENLKLYEKGQEKRQYHTDKIPCDVCKSLQYSYHMARHQKQKMCQRARKAMYANKSDQSTLPSDKAQVGS